MYHKENSNFNESQSASLEELAERLAVYDQIDLLATVAAMQLMPENADRYFRLEVLAHVVASLPYEEGHPNISLGRLKSVLTSPPLGDAWVGMQDDPFEQLFTDTVAFHGGAFVVFPGIAEYSVYIFRLLTKAVFLLPGLPFNDEFLTEARSLITSVLALSNEVARRAGLGRGVQPLSALSNHVVMPSGERARALKQSSVFSIGEVDELLRRYDLTHQVLSPLISPIGSVLLDNFDFENSPLLMSPIVSFEDTLVVALPGMLLSAVRHAILCLAINHGAQENVVRRFNQAVWGNVVTSLDYLKAERQFVPPLSPPNIPFMMDGFFSFDTDKAIFAIILTDNLVDYRSDEVFGEWAIEGLLNQVRQSINAAQRFLLELPQSPNEVLFLFVVQSFGRMTMGSLDILVEGLAYECLDIAASELELVAMLESGEPLLLWKFARASSLFSGVTTVFTFGTLSKFWYYREAGYSYYFSDDAQPSLMNLSSSGSRAMKLMVNQQRDWHSVMSPDRLHITEVTSYHSDREIPIYASLDKNGQSIKMLVEGLPIPIWVKSPDVLPNEEQILRQNYIQFADAITYWLWQFTPRLGVRLASLQRHSQIAVMEIHLPLHEDWTRIVGQTGNCVQPPVQVRTDVETSAIFIVICASIVPICLTSDNAGERLLMSHVLTGLRQLLPPKHQALLSDDEIAAIINEFAPLGQKKMLLMLNSEHVAELERTSLPPFRKLQEADTNNLLDELGEHLRNVYHLGQGEIKADVRTEVLKETVGFYYKELEHLVASLNPVGLVEWLLRQHESALQHIAGDNLTTPTRLACFGENQELAIRLRNEMQDSSSVSLASRFAIEYVVSRPPIGLRPISLSVYDRLIALSWEITNFGFISDVVHYQLADIGLAVLPSGRLGQDRDEYENAQRSFFKIFSAEAFSESRRRFQRYWQSETQNADKPDVLKELDQATTEEFQISLTEIVLLLRFLANEGFKSGSGIGCMSMADFTGNIKNELAWTQDQINYALELLLLRPREEFLKPPHPFRSFDTWPWRFNRKLSYIRRPLLLRSGHNGEQILWGPRHLDTASRYLLDIILSGRLPAQNEKQSAKMSELLGRLNGGRGNEFEVMTEKALSVVQHFTVKRSVTKVGKLRLGNVGDIDILVADIRKQRITIIECKDLVRARTPYEMGNQIMDLYDPNPGKKSAVNQAIRKARWVQENLSGVLEWLGLSTSRKWKVEPIVVVDHLMMTTYLRQLPIPIVPINDLLQYMQR